MAGARGETLLNLMLFIEMFTLKGALEGLTDDEMFWEPAPGCWSVRRRGEHRSEHFFGEGEWVLEYDEAVANAPAGSPLHPLTTIAWNLAHIANAPGDLASMRFLGGDVDPSVERGAGATVSSADEARDRLWTGWRSLDRALHASDDAALEERWSWAFGETTGFQHIALMLNEISHHGAQVCELRDVRRALLAGR